MEMDFLTPAVTTPWNWTSYFPYMLELLASLPFLFLFRISSSSKDKKY